MDDETPSIVTGGEEPVFQKARSEQVKTRSTTAEEIVANVPIRQPAEEEEEQKQRHKGLLGVSADEIEADKSLSGGNLSASGIGVTGPVGTTSDDGVMKKIYHSNHCTTATYKLEGSSSAQAVEVLD